MFANFDKQKLQANFSRAARNYDEAAPIQHLAAEKLCEMAAEFIKNDSRILDLGAGTGFVAGQILKQVQDDGEKVRHPELVSGSTFPTIFEIDISAEMLQQKRPCPTIKIQGDFENLPFKNNSFDILISSYSLQWLSNFEKNFAQFFSLLKPNGIFIFCLPTHGSLKELQAANIFNFNQLPKIEELKSALENCGFREILCQSETNYQNFDSGISAIKSLKKIGANYSQKNHKTLTRTNLAQFNNFCLKNSCDDNRRIEISWITSYFIFRT